MTTIFEPSTCIICCEKQNKSTNKPVKCQYCDFECCKKCCKTYVLDQSTVRCMNNDCAKEWTRQYIRKVFPLVFINGELKEHREQVLFDQERSLMPTTQPFVERRILIENLQKEELQIKDQITQLQRQLYDISNRIYNFRYNRGTDAATSATSTERTTFVRACPSEDCRGFLSSQWKCGICQKWTCPTCHIVKGEERDCEHTCDPNDVATAELLSRDTKPCPKCSMGIFKIDGCNSMWCTQCQTSFDWRTGRIETGFIHNPHYFEWMNRNRAQHAAQDPNAMCERELDHRILITMNSNFLHYITRSERLTLEEKKEKKEKVGKILNIGRNILHLRAVELNRYQFNYEQNNQELRILYMMNRITETDFKNKLQVQNKKHHKHLELRNVLLLVIESASDIIRRLHQTANKPTWDFNFHIMDEITTLKDYANECFTDISRTYSSNKLQLNEMLEIIRYTDRKEK